MLPAISPRVDVEDDLNALHIALEQVQQAKVEALQYCNVGKSQMSREISHLCGLLQRSKKEKDALERKIEELEKQLSDEKLRNEELVLKSEVDRRVFARMIKEDREAAAVIRIELEEKVSRAETELQETLAWAHERQKKPLMFDAQQEEPSVLGE